MGFFKSRKKNTESNEIKPPTHTVNPVPAEPKEAEPVLSDDTVPSEIVAAVIAAVSAFMRAEPGYAGFRVVGIKKASAWSQTAKTEQQY
jgi:hypothetical protein